MTVTVAYVVGGNNWVPCYVSLYSLLSNNPETAFEVFVLSEEERDPRFFGQLDALAAVHPEFSVEFVPVDGSAYADLPVVGDHLTAGVYYKLGLDELLPTASDRVLYLDTDTVVDGELTGLVDTDVGDAVVAAAPFHRNETVSLGLAHDEQYFNAGVLYVNLENWRAYDVERRVREYVEREDAPLNEQTALNAVLYGLDAVRTVHPRYNATGEWARQFRGVDRDPVIVHYDGNRKPWFAGVNRPYGERWGEYCRATPFAGDRPRADWRNALGIRRRSVERAVSRRLDDHPTVYSVVRRLYGTLVG